MPGESTAYLVVRRDDGFGDVFSLTPGQRYTLGRANTNRIVLKDDLCSREHAEFYHADNRWRLRDLNSLNGTRINGDKLDSEWELSPGDEVFLGRTRLMFVDDIGQLPGLPQTPEPVENLAIKKRLGQTRYMTPVPPEAPPADADATGVAAPARHALSRDLGLLYRLALDMGAADSLQELNRLVLDALLESTPADTGAILMLKDGGELELAAHRHRDAADRSYMAVSKFVSKEVLSTREAIWAEDLSTEKELRDRVSLTEFGATSLICAPVASGEKVLGLIHLYCLGGNKAFANDDLEFALAVAKQLGNAIFLMQRQASLSAENRSLRDQLRLESELVGDSRAIKDIESQIRQVAATNATVLVRGESGTGKELVARAIHYSSPRRDGPFICLNCAALTETLLESELFGHEKGSFTGATERKIGKFESADGGTLFLDEIGEMTVQTQAKLLRMLEGHPFERVGGHTAIRVNVRVVSATNQQLEQAIQTGAFRRDLFFRLQVVEIRIAPLREHRSDVPLLADHFLERFVRETGRKLLGFTPEALRKMGEYNWPGNIRELRNVVERAVALGKGPILDTVDIWLSALEVDSAGRPGSGSGNYRALSLEELEKQHILRTLQHTDWNKSQAASILRIERSTLDRKIKLYDLKR